MLQIVEKITKYKVKCKCNQCDNTYIVNKYDALKSKVGHLCLNCKNQITQLNHFTQNDLLNVFIYEPNTGLLKYKNDSISGLKNTIAGHKHNEGYMCVMIGKKSYLVHRIIWLMQTGKLPEQIDHINHNRSDNRWINLRNVVSRENQLNTGLSKNNKTGVNGVRVLPSDKYCAYIMVNRKQISLGSYKTLEEAKLARQKANKKYNFHLNHGN